MSDENVPLYLVSGIDIKVWEDLPQKERERLIQEAKTVIVGLDQVADHKAWLAEKFTERELALIANCCDYANSAPAGLPGHNLMIIVAKLADLLEMAE